MNRLKNSDFDLKDVFYQNEQITSKEKKSALQAAGKNDILSLCEYEQAIVGSEGLESFRRKHRYGVYIFKIYRTYVVGS